MTEPKQFITGGLRGTLSRDVDMRRHTTWRAGGSAERFYQPAGLDDLAAFLRALPKDEPLLAVGLGSNLLVRDGGWRGTVVLMHAALDELRMELITMKTGPQDSSFRSNIKTPTANPFLGYGL